MSVTASAPSVEIAENLHAYVEAEIIIVPSPLIADLDPGLKLKTNLYLHFFFPLPYSIRNVKNLLSKAGKKILIHNYVFAVLFHSQCCGSGSRIRCFFDPG
jgi:hypothetical protein